MTDRRLGREVSFCRSYTLLVLVLYIYSLGVTMNAGRGAAMSGVFKEQRLERRYPVGIFFHGCIPIRSEGRGLAICRRSDAGAADGVSDAHEQRSL